MSFIKHCGISFLPRHYLFLMITNNHLQSLGGHNLFVFNIHRRERDRAVFELTLGAGALV